MDEGIKNKAKILKNSDIFSNHTDNAPYAEKQCILLVLVGKKPVSEATTCTWIITPTSCRAKPADHKEVKNYLKKLGLYCYVYDYENATIAAVSLDSSLIKKYIKLNDKGTAADDGALFGYPQTAIEAFGKQELMMDLAKQNKIMKNAGLPEFMPAFRFSKANYKDELKVLKDWHETLKLYELV